MLYLLICFLKVLPGSSKSGLVEAHLCPVCSTLTAEEILLDIQGESTILFKTGSKVKQCHLNAIFSKAGQNQ